MQAFLSRQYRPIFTVLLLSIIGLAYYVGTLQAQKGSRGGVTLACSDEVLSALSIPAASAVQAKKSVQTGDLTAAATDPTDQDQIAEEGTQSPAATTGAYMGSKNGTKYYAPDCPAAKRIKPENVVWFQTAEDASLQGYTAASC